MKPEEWDAVLAAKPMTHWQAVLAEGAALFASYENAAASFDAGECKYELFKRREDELREWAANNAGDLLSAARREQRMREALRKLHDHIVIYFPDPNCDICAQALAALAAEKGEQT